MKNFTLSILLLVLTLNVTIAQKKSSNHLHSNEVNDDFNHKRVLIDKSIPNLFKKLDDAGIDLGCGVYHTDKNLQIELSKYELSRVSEQGISYTVLIDDMTKFYSERAKRDMPEAQRQLLKDKAESSQNKSVSIKNVIIDNIGQRDECSEINWTTPTNFIIPSTFGGCLTYSGVQTELDKMRTLYPNLISVKANASPTNQTSVQGRTVYVVKISDNPDINETEAQVLYTGMTHAREVSSMMNQIYFMWYVLENYNSDPFVKSLVDNTEMFFIPVVNPDGLAWNETIAPSGGGMQRKNLKAGICDTGGTSTSNVNRGVDINRNFGYYYGLSGSSTVLCDGTYRGTGAFSEPETQIMRDFILSKNIKTALNHHAFSNLLPHPVNGNANTPTGRENEFAKFCHDMTQYNRYVYGPAPGILYAASGDASDWMCGGAADGTGNTGSGKNILSVSPENGAASGEGGFWPTPTQIPIIARRALRMNFINAYYAGKYAKLHDLTQSNITALNSNLTFGIERLGQTASTYTLTVTPISSNIVSITSPTAQTGMTILEQRTVTAALVLNAGIKPNEKIEYQITLSNGDYTLFKANYVKIFQPTLLLDNNPDVDLLTKWTATGTAWINSTDTFTGTKSITDASGAYPNGLDNTTTAKSKILTTTSAFNLSGAQKILVQYYAKWDLERNFDMVQIQGSTNGTTWTTLCGNYTKPTSNTSTNPHATKASTNNFQSATGGGGVVYDGDTMDKWVMEEIVVDATNNSFLVGATAAKFRFRLMSDTSNAADGYTTTFDGFYFDDFKVIKQISEPPVAICKNATLAIGTNGTLTVLATDVNNGSIDDIGIVSTSVSPNTFNCTQRNTTQNVTLTVTDADGQTSTCSATITITDPNPIAGLVSANQTICTGTQPTNITLSGNTGTIQWQSSNDNVSFTNISGQTSATLTGATIGNLTATRYFRAVITRGNCATSVNSNVVTININPNPTNSSISPNSRLAGSGAFTLTVNGTNFINGESIVRWNGTNRTTTFVSTTQLTAAITATDVASSGTANVTIFNTCNSSTTASQTFTISAGCTAPVANVTNLPTLTAQCSLTVTPPTATSSCYGQITGTTNSPLTYNSQGNFQIYWTYNDGNGNVSNQFQQISINDTNAPVANVTNLPTITAQCNTTISTIPTATDNCIGTVNATTTDPLTYNVQGSYSILWSYADNRGNLSYQTQNVIINDTTAPVPNVTTLPTLNGQCSVTAVAPTATDNCSGTVTATTINPTTYNTQGNYTITWTYTDAKGNSSSQTQSVVINDTLVPVANVASLPTLNAQCAVTLTAPTATDNCSGQITATTTTVSPVTTSTTVTWTYTDAKGNSSSQTQSVIINDTLAPVANVASLPTLNGQCAVTLTAPTATDNCSGQITATTTTVSPVTTSTTVTWTYTDAKGNSSSQTQSVVINDTLAPVANVASLPTLNGQCAVTLTAPTATDNCSGQITATTTTVSPVTTSTTVTWTYTDAKGNSSSQTQSVVINDTLAPVANVASLPTLNGQCFVTLTAPTATDNCSGQITATTTTVSPVTTSTTVTWTYTDAKGNSSSQTQSVVINDTLAPVANVASLPTLNAQCAVTLTAPTATDNCSGQITATTTTVSPVTTSTTVTWTYTDAKGNSSSQTQSVVINDTLAPVANVASLPTLNAQCAVTLTAPTATDNCSGQITATTTTVSPVTTSTTVTWTYTDAKGNSSSQTQSVVINDTLAPVANVASLPTLNAQCAVTLTAPTATDNCSGQITATTTTVSPVTTSTTVTWTYTDAKGNSSSQTQSVIINDTLAPVANVASLPTLNGQCAVTLTAPTATDNCSGQITATTTTVSPVTTSTTVTWTYTDAKGNSSSQTQSVVINDTLAPVANVASLPTLNGQCAVTLTAPTATDNCSGQITATTTTVSPVTTSTTVTWTYTDAKGNSSSQTQSVVINDTLAPVANVASLPTLNGQCFVTLTAPTATDNCSGQITATTTTVSPVTTSTTVTWTYTDAKGNSSSQTQSVVINDTLAPVANVASLPTLNAQCAVTLTAPTATDNCSGQITATTTTVSPVTTSTTVTWTYTDAKGNSSSQTQSVVINDTLAPVANVASLPTLNGQCAVTLTAPTATDNCSGQITATTTTVSPVTTSTTVTWTYTDAKGNSSSQTQSVVINDTLAPVANVASLPTLNGQCAVTLTAPTATDNCSGQITATTTTVSPVTTSTTVTWTYTDAKGNSSSQTQSVVINDTLAPVANVASLPTLNGQCAVTLTAPTATDNCSGQITATTTTVSPVTTSTTVTWTYTDAKGNSSSQTQSVVINDTLVPVANVASLPTLNAQCAVTLTAPTATDNCSGQITATTTTVSPVTTSTTVTWTYTDAKGNSSSQTQSVVINDTLAPVANVASLPTLNGQCAVTLTAPTATDNCSGQITATTTTVSPVTTSTTVTWTYTDAKGNSSSQTQSVVINDTLAPVANVASLPTLNGQCFVTLTAPTATDNCSGQITATTTTVSPVTTSTTVTWTYTDAKGNSSSQTQSVVINDTLAPVANVASLPTLNAQCAVTLTAPTATDNCSGQITATTTTVSPVTTSTTVTWTYTDAKGNSSSQTQSVVINDTLAPVANVASLPTLNAQCAVTLTAPTATDNCSGQITATTTTVSPVTTSTTVTWTYTDAKGNSSSQTQSVVINDTLAPVANVASLPTLNGQCAVTLTAPTATDNCSGQITATTTTVSPVTTSTTVTWTYTDAKGNSSSQTQSVVINDTLAPVANVASLPTLNAQCAVTLTAPTATDNCSGQITATTTTVSPVTTSTTVTWTYTDAKGNSSSQTQSVVINDTLAPVANVASLPTLNGQCAVTLTAPTATDNCSGQITATTTTVSPVTTSTTVTWTYTDAKGNSSSQTQSVVINDTLAPVANVASLPTLNGQCAVTLTAPTATDNCSGQITATTTTVSPVTTSTTVTWTYTDAKGNSSSQTQSVVINDTLAPVANVASLPTLNGQCAVTLTAPTATDNCSGQITATTTTVSPVTTSTTVTWTYTDAKGNSSSQTQSVVINDTLVPVANVASLPTLNAQCAVTLTAPTATDNCSGQITATTTTVSPVTTSTTVTWTYTDAKGNSSSQTQSVIINDTLAPVANVASLPTLNGQCAVTLTAPTATDNCSGQITATTTTVSPVTTSTTVTWTYTDAKGNSSSQTQSVVINDTLAPVANVASLPTLNGQCAVTLTAPTATDNCSGQITATTTTVSPVTTSTTVTWTYTDAKGNSSSQTQSVVINDTLAPVANVASLPTLNGQCFVTLTAPTATDNCSGQITATTTTVSPVTTSTTVTWTYTDAKGNSSSQTQSVVINDTLAPVANVASLPTLNAQCAVTLTAPTATDNCSGQITATTTTVSPVTTSTTVTWTYTDAKGNSSSQTQSVVINDTLAPVANVASLPTLNGQCAVTLTAPTATDNCSGQITATTTTVSPVTTSTTVTWTYTDAKGNSSSQTQSVVINDTLAPVANVASLPTLNGQCAVTLTAPTATDNCSGQITATTTTVSPVTTSTTVTWTYTDAKGNSSSQTQSVVINDTLAPVANVASLPTLNGQCFVTLTAPTATDNCSGQITATTTTVSPVTTSTTVTWTYTDAKGNSSSQTQSVVVEGGITYYQDADGDTFGNSFESTQACSQPIGYVTNNTDCDDSNPNLTSLITYYQDVDADGFGNSFIIVQSCSQPFGYVTNNSDCNDNQIQYEDNDNDGYGSQTQVACGVTNNIDCDDDNSSAYLFVTFYRDFDNDGFGNPSNTIQSCFQPLGYVSNNADCNDNQLQYADNDNDGYGSQIKVACGVTNNTDCNDNIATANGLITFYQDSDGDGYGNPTVFIQTCFQPTGYVTNNSDCNDTNNAAYNNAVEICGDGIDNNCNGFIDENCVIGETNLQSNLCGATLSTINQNIFANLVSGAQAYRFRIRNVSTNQVQTIDKALRVFQLTQLATYAYNTTYVIQVAVKKQNVWKEYGAGCVVNTPNITTRIQTSQCDLTTTDFSLIIYANAVNYISAYRFRLTNSQNANDVQIVERPLRDIRLNSFTNLILNNQYFIDVSFKNVDGTYSTYGSVCIINTGELINNRELETSANTDIKIVTYPNPFSDSFTLKSDIENNSTITVLIYDLTGRQMESIKTEYSELKNLHLGANYPAGVYSLIIQSEQVTKSLRVIKR